MGMEVSLSSAVAASVSYTLTTSDQHWPVPLTSDQHCSSDDTASDHVLDVMFSLVHTSVHPRQLRRLSRCDSVV